MLRKVLMSITRNNQTRNIKMQTTSITRIFVHAESRFICLQSEFWVKSHAKSSYWPIRKQAEKA